MSRFIRDVVFVILVAACSNASANQSSKGYTGNPVDRSGGTCAGCHAETETTQFSGATAVLAGSTNTFTLSSSNPAAVHFNLSTDAGSLAPADGATRVYAASAGSFGEGLEDISRSANSYNFQWTAPAQGAMATFYACSGTSVTLPTIEFSGCGSLVVTVQGAPEAVDDRFAVSTDSSDTDLRLLANDSTSDSRTISAVSTPDSGGSAVIDGAGPDNRVLYTPQAGFNGTETFTYTLRDGLGFEDQATATVIVGSFPPPKRVIASTGYLTPIEFAEPSIGAEYGLVAPYAFSRSLEGPLRPGRHEVLWTVTDANDEQLVGSQIVDILPRLSMSVEQTVVEGDDIEFYVFLNGPAPEYPVSYTLSESGSADAADYFLVARTGDIVNDTTLSEYLLFRTNVDADTEGLEQVTFTLSDPLGAVLGSRSSHSVAIDETNTPPSVFLYVQQAFGGRGSLLLAGGGQVTIDAQVDDNNGQSHSFAWSSPTLADNDGDSLDGEFGFDPAALTIGSTHRVKVTVSDDGQPQQSTTTTVVLSVLGPHDYDAMNANAADPDDDDGDGSSDVAEGFDDIDLDGIPDHLDHNSTPVTRLQNQSGNLARQQFIETEPGLRLQLGQIARSALRYGAAISAVDVANYGGVDGAATPIDSPPSLLAGPWDFEIRQLPPGAVASVVLPLSAPLPEGAALLKFINGEWRAFSVDASNQYASARADAGTCPAPGSLLYAAGLGRQHNCIQLMLEDGGPNDADGEPNGVIADPAALAFDVAGGSEQTTDTLDDGSSVTLPFLLGLLFICLLAHSRQRRREQRL